MIEAVIFDMDGVLIDSEPLHYQTDLTLLKSMGIHVEPSYLDRFVGMINPEMWEMIIAEHNITRNLEEILKEQIDLKLSLLADGDWQAIPGTLELVEQLVTDGIQLALASSSSLPFIKAVLHKTGLDRFIPRYVSAESVRQGKPAPDVFLEAARLLNTEPARCVVIEDSRNGVLAARAAGMKVIAYQNPSSGNQDLSSADIIVSSHRKTAQALDQIRGGSH